MLHMLVHARCTYRPAKPHLHPGILGRGPRSSSSYCKVRECDAGSQLGLHGGRRCVQEANILTSQVHELMDMVAPMKADIIDRDGPPATAAGSRLILFPAVPEVLQLRWCSDQSNGCATVA